MDVNQKDINPSLFGIKNSNRNFNSPECWGKNQFNSSFPIALCCYLFSKNIKPVYIVLGDSLSLEKQYIEDIDLFGCKYSKDDLHFLFEVEYSPFNTLIEGHLPRIDCCTFKDNKFLRGIEIKLTAIPDHSTFLDSDNLYGSEIVVRPDTIVYIALQIMSKVSHEIIGKYFSNLTSINDWSDGVELVARLPDILGSVRSFLNDNKLFQSSIMMQPIWKTEGKKLILHNNAFDVFVWSDFAILGMLVDIVSNSITKERKNITRQLRSIIWFSKMLLDSYNNKIVNYGKILDHITLNTKNDKAFAISGNISRKYMMCKELSEPRINKTEIKNIILGNGHLLLSPERRLDAVILSTPNLFDNV